MLSLHCYSECPNMKPADTWFPFYLGELWLLPENITGTQICSACRKQNNIWASGIILPLATCTPVSRSVWEGDRSQPCGALKLEYLLESSWLPSSSGAVWKMRHVRGHACSFLPAGHTSCSRLFTPCSTEYQGLLTQVWLAFLQRRVRLVLFVFKLEEKSFLELLPLAYFTW